MAEPHDTVVLFSPVRRPEPKAWRIIRVTQDDGYGCCNFADREIELDPKLQGRLLVDTSLHESAHAACPDLSEAAVNRLVKCQMAVLAYLGLVPAEDE